MSSQFESKRHELESIINNKKRMGIGAVVLGVIIAVSNIIYAQFLSNLIPINRDLQAISLLISFFCFIGYYDYLASPVSPYDYAFFEIVEALKLIEMSGNSEVINKQAKKRVNKAYKKLYSQQVTRSNAPWSSEHNEVEKIFKKNLITRIAPAIMNNTIAPAYLIDIAVALKGTHISMLKTANDTVMQLDELRGTSETTTSKINAFISNNEVLSNIISNKVFNLFIVFGGGFIVMAILCFIYSFLFPVNTFKGLVSDPGIFLLGGLAIPCIYLAYIAIDRRRDTSLG